MILVGKVCNTNAWRSVERPSAKCSCKIRDPETLWKDHIINAVMDLFLEEVDAFIHGLIKDPHIFYVHGCDANEAEPGISCLVKKIIIPVTIIFFIVTIKLPL